MREEDEMRNAGSTITPKSSTRESWLQTRLQGGVGMKTRDAARAILASRSADDPMRAVLVEALHEMVDETERWKNAWAHEHVDKDRKVRDAMAKAADCEHHGQEIRDLNRQLDNWTAAYDRAEADRLALLGWLQIGRDYIDIITAVAATGGKLPSAVEVRDWMKAAIEKASRAHDRAWKPRKKGAAD